MNKKDINKVRNLFIGFCKAEKPHVIYEDLNRVSFFGKWNDGLLATLDIPSTYLAINEAMIEAKFLNFDVLRENICSPNSQIKIRPFTIYETSR